MKHNIKKSMNLSKEVSEETSLEWERILHSWWLNLYKYRPKPPVKFKLTTLNPNTEYTDERVAQLLTNCVAS